MLGANKRFQVAQCGGSAILQDLQEADKPVFV
jgi:hypothetical protein